ncbi:hypothetical protein HMPREF9303_2222 [Prevotella denticola CRIS 18C-A]|uniref:Uncharacterized protein n=1 Tax=Prevotella denticola CRIS 18C-A TaxID=944557 RepID=F0H4A8_9BACT|nr:hypothetical protein HMPREF9303_2222 [Prevotella denticola CRIS 18C-A]
MPYIAWRGACLLPEKSCAGRTYLSRGLFRKRCGMVSLKEVMGNLAV